MSIKPKIGQKLWVVRYQINDGIVQEHPISKEMDFVEIHAKGQEGHLYHFTKNEAIDGICNHLQSLKDKDTLIQLVK